MFRLDFQFFVFKKGVGFIKNGCDFEVKCLGVKCVDG